MIVTMLMAACSKVMGEHAIGFGLKAVGWISTAAMTAAAVALVAINFGPKLSA